MSAMELATTVLANNTNLKAYYRFSSGAETTDSSGNSNTLTAIGTPTYSAGKFGQGVDLASASSQAFSIVDHASIKPTGSFSFGGWVKTSTAAVQIVMQSQSQNTNVAGIQIYLDASGKVNFLSGRNTGTVNNTDYKFTTSNTAVHDGNWHLVIGTWDGATMRTYIDAKHDISAAWANTPGYAATNYPRIGCSNNSGTNAQFFNGSLDDVFLLNGTALSADQIKELYEGRLLGEGWPQANLQGLYHMSSTTDSGGNNYTLTNNGTVTFTAGKFVNAADFGSTNTTKYFQIAQNFGITTGVNATFAFWYKCSAEPGNNVYYRLFEHAGGATDRFFNLSYNNNAGTNRLHMNVSGTATVYNVTLGTTSWHYLVAVRDTSVAYIYLDGAQVASGSLGTSQPGIAAALSIGADIGAGAGAYTNGQIDEFQVFNVAKSADWVRKQYALGRGFYV